MIDLNEKDIAYKLIHRFNTNCPYTIAEYLNITVKFSPLGSINGYYTTAYNNKFININSEISEHRQRFTMAHELGHAMLHPTANTPFLTEKTLFSVSKFERQANKFAVYLLIPDSELTQYEDISFEQVSTIFGVPEKLLDLRF